MKHGRAENMGSDQGGEHLRESEKESLSAKSGSLHPPRTGGGSVMISMQPHARLQKI